MLKNQVFEASKLLKKYINTIFSKPLSIKVIKNIYNIRFIKLNRLYEGNWAWPPRTCLKFLRNGRGCLCSWKSKGAPGRGPSFLAVASPRRSARLPRTCPGSLRERRGYLYSWVWGCSWPRTFFLSCNVSS
jgi:hypothetical protein